MTLNVPNLDKLIAHLEAQPPERINMGWVSVLPREDCGTCGCIMGHTLLAFHLGRLNDQSFERILGISSEQRSALTMPKDWDDEKGGVRRYPAHRVIATLKRLRDLFLVTGEVVVDWGPEPGSEPAQPWSAPQAIEIREPPLPETLTRLLGAKVEA